SFQVPDSVILHTTTSANTSNSGNPVTCAVWSALSTIWMGSFLKNQQSCPRHYESGGSCKCRLDQLPWASRFDSPRHVILHSRRETRRPQSRSRKSCASPAYYGYAGAPQILGVLFEGHSWATVTGDRQRQLRLAPKSQRPAAKPQDAEGSPPPELPFTTSGK